MSTPARSGEGQQPLRISVALCTYNGERFLERQLQSIAAQTRLPDELIICDDGSQDRTVAIAEEFAGRVAFRVLVVRNPVNLGSNRNFQQAIELCTGDLIALSDQDDLWLPERLARSEAALQEHPDRGLVFTDATVIDDEDRPTGRTLWQNFLFTPELQEAMRRGSYTPLARYRFITGATVMFRARYRPFLFPILGEWIHDGWIAMMIAALSGVCLIAEPLVQYRQHASQQVGLGNGKLPRSKTMKALALRHWASVDGHRVILKDVEAGLARLQVDPRCGAAADFLRQLRFLEQRLALPANRLARIWSILRLRAEYRVGASGWWSVAKDIVLPKRPSEQGAAAESGFSLFAKATPGGERAAVTHSAV